MWLFPYNGPVDLRNATTDEVAQARWLSPAQVLALLQSGEMVGSLSYFRNFSHMTP